MEHTTATDEIEVVKKTTELGHQGSFGRAVEDAKLPAAEMNKTYEHNVKLVSQNNGFEGKVEVVSVHSNSSEFTAELQDKILRIKGLPTKEGNVNFLIEFSIIKQEGGRLNNTAELRLQVSPDPAHERNMEIQRLANAIPSLRVQSGNECCVMVELKELRQFLECGSIGITNIALSDPSLKIVEDMEDRLKFNVVGTTNLQPGKVITANVKYLLHTNAEDGEEHSVSIPMLQVLADPKKMFRDLPTDTAAPYQTPNSDTNIIVNEKTVVAASKRGRSHAHDGKFRDDNFKIEHLKDLGWYVVVVSDGAGSAEFSREGSRITCETFCDMAKQQLTKLETDEKYADINTEYKIELVRKIVLSSAYEGMKAINEAAQKDGNPRKKYAATMLAYAAKKIGDEWLIVSMGIGDGFIAVLRRDEDGKMVLSPMSEPDGGEFVGQTRFITMDEVWHDNPARRVKVLRIKDFDMILSMTDGVSDPWFETDNNLQSVEMWQAFRAEIEKNVPFEKRDNETAAKLLEWLDFYIKGNHDDRTIAVMY